MFFDVETQMSLRVAMTQCTRGDHLGVEQGVAAEQAVEIAAVAIGPIHHGGDGRAPYAERLIHIVFSEKCCVQTVIDDKQIAHMGDILAASHPVTVKTKEAQRRSTHPVRHADFSRADYFCSVALGTTAQTR